MTDITKCANKKCKINDFCYRYTANDGYWQSYAKFNEGKIVKDKKECSSFIQSRKKAEFNEQNRK